MPKFEKLTTAEVEQLRTRRVRPEPLKEYVDFLQKLKPGEWGRVNVQSGESQRTIKRRLTTAGKQHGMRVKYKPGKGAPGQVVFEVQSGA